MKKIIPELATCAIFIANTSFGVFAANSITLTPLFSLDNQVCGELVIRTPADNLPFTLQIYENSAEAANQLIYQAELSPSSEYICTLDDSEYTFRITASRFKTGENINEYSGSIAFPLPEELNGVDFCRAEIELGFSDDLSQNYYTETGAVSIDENHTLSQQLHLDFALADEILGDISGDGMISETDATQVLFFYAASILHADPPSNQQLILGDIDGDNALTAIDATMILRYFAGSMLNPNISWNDILS